MSELNNPTPNSVLAQLRAKRTQLAASNKVKDLEVPGQPELVIRYKRLSWDQARPLVQALSGSDDDPIKELSAVMDTLIEACQCVLIRDGDELKHLDGTPVRFEKRLAHLLGDDEATSPPEVLASVFLEDELSIMDQGGSYLAWLNHQEDQVDVELGKSSDRTDD